MLSEYERFARVLADVGETPCQSAPDAFFPEDADNTMVEAEQRRIAKALCSECPIKAECLAYALAVNEQFGIWGGMTLYQRRELARGWKA